MVDEAIHTLEFGKLIIDEQWGKGSAWEQALMRQKVTNIRR